MNGVLFLCTGNACRSQMAEGLARRVLPPDVSVFSAGTKPKGVDPRAVLALGELGVDIADQRSKSLDVPLASVRHVVTLCGDAAEECPVLPDKRRERWGLPDPALAEGSSDEVLKTFRSVRDEIFSRVRGLAARLRPEPAVGIIGGSGFYDLPGLTDVVTIEVDTPFGRPSAPLVTGRLHGRRVVFLARHGEGHRLLPSEVNARANIYALKGLGIAKLISISAVGSLREEIAPGHVVVPSQFLDRTVGRPATFFGDGVVAHVSLADPVCGELADVLVAHARTMDTAVHASGTYLCIEGPQFSTRAESALWRSWGADVIGMTNLPEARLAHEAELCYATVALPTEYDCWRTRTDEVRVADVLASLRANVEKARQILSAVIEHVDPNVPCACQRALDTALLTPPAAIDVPALIRLHALLQRRLPAAEPTGCEVAA